MGIQQSTLIGYGIIMSYVRGGGRQYNRYLIIKVVEHSTSRVDNLIGRRILIKDSKGNVYSGKIVRTHGKGVNNKVIAYMRRSIPGQLLGARALII